VLARMIDLHHPIAEGLAEIQPRCQSHR
jgi:hypothetical protein